MNIATVATAAIALAFVVHVEAQWQKVPDRNVSRATGKPNLSAPAPRTAQHTPDLSGVWLADPDPQGKPAGLEQAVYPRYMINIAADLKPEEDPLRPEAAKIFAERLQRDGTDSPEAHCKPIGAPRFDAFPLPYKILQTPSLVLILYETETDFRQIFLDGRKPVEDPLPRWMGYSRGHWDGDTLVVDTTGFADGIWLDAIGHPSTSQLHLIERFRRPDAGHLTIEVTIDDPGAYTRPITYTQPATLQPDSDLLEYYCAENEKDAQHYE